MKVSVIIPNWDGFNLLQDCLKSVFDQLYKDYEVIVVDNASSDESVKYVRTHFSKVKIIQLNRNYGFARGINEGIKLSKAKYIILLNNDTKVNQDFIKSLVECADKNSDVISVNSKLLNFFDKQSIDGVGMQINEVGQAQSIGWQERDKGQHDKEQFIFGATGGASLFRRKDFLKVGLFDSSFFMYSEEVDFAFRAQFLGYKSIYCSKAVVYHRHKASAKRKPQHIEYWQFRNMTATIIKDFPTSIILKKWRWLKIILVHFNTIFYQLKNGFFWAPFLADLWIIFHLQYLLKERSRIQKSRVVSDEYIESFLKEKKITFWGLQK